MLPDVSRTAMLLMMMLVSAASLAQTPSPVEPARSRSEQTPPAQVQPAPVPATSAPPTEEPPALEPEPPVTQPATGHRAPTQAPPVRPEPPIVPRSGSNLISEALCGVQNEERVRAQALDAGKMASAWRRSPISDIDKWLNAPKCGKKSTNALATDKRRRDTLRQTQLQIADMRRIEAELMQVLQWRPIYGSWPAQCGSCDQLDVAAKAAMLTAEMWPDSTEGQTEKIGWWIDAMETRRSLLAALCMAKPPGSARTTLQSKFAFYSWTTSGRRLLDAADWYDRRDFAAWCAHQ